MTDNTKLTRPKVTRECALCGLITEEKIVVCPVDGSALITHKPDPLIGAIIGGKFEILTLLGSGGMGNVYKALQKPVGRHVALKILHSEKLIKNNTVLRFQQEAKAAAVLSHPNIVGFFDYGLTEDNVPYIVMDYVEGVPLDETLKREGPISPERCVQIFTQVCDALEHAHQRGVIHRDIKPSNLMITIREDGSEAVKVLDFGIAKLTLAANENGTTLTQTGEIFGSPQYMSPEQCNSVELDARSDIYSLGCVMYELLMGKPALRGDNIVQTVYKHTNEKPASFKSIRPDAEIPDQLEAVIMKTLEKEPAMRFPSMSALKRNLEFVSVFTENEKTMPPHQPNDAKSGATDAPASEDRNSESSDMPTWLQWALPIGAVVVALSAGAGYFWWKHSGPESQIAWIRMTENSKSEKLLAPARTMRNKLMEENRFVDATQYAVLALDLSKQFQANTIDEVNDLTAASEVLSAQNDPRGKEYLFQARELLRKLAKDGRDQKRWAENAALDQKILGIDKQVEQVDDRDGIADQLNESEDLRKAGAIDASLTTYDHLYETKAKLNREQQTSLFDALNMVANDLSARGNSDKAETYYRNAVALGTELFGANNIKVLKAKRALGLFFQKASRYTSAEPLLQDTLAQASSSLGASDEFSIQLLDDLAKLYEDERELKTASEMRKLAQSLKDKK